MEQVVISIHFRKKYGIKPETKVGFSEDNKGNIIIRVLNKTYLENLRLQERMNQ
jgi:bifunctional DNA-binding transcriptional regulator/antitoxin component of YhaV-PrlF toxin-antitoxin module